MSFPRRLALIALALPTWIVMILAGGEWCPMPGSASAHLASEQAISHVPRDTHAAPHARVPVSGDRSMPVPHRSHHSGERVCTSPAACSVAVAPTSLELVAGAHQRPTRPLVLRTERPTSVVVAPELPPPRA